MVELKLTAQELLPQGSRDITFHNGKLYVTVNKRSGEIAHNEIALLGSPATALLCDAESYHHPVPLGDSLFTHDDSSNDFIRITGPSLSRRSLDDIAKEAKSAGMGINPKNDVYDLLTDGQSLYFMMEPTWMVQLTPDFKFVNRLRLRDDVFFGDYPLSGNGAVFLQDNEAYGWIPYANGQPSPMRELDENVYTFKLTEEELDDRVREHLGFLRSRQQEGKLRKGFKIPSFDELKVQLIEVGEIYRYKEIVGAATDGTNVYAVSDDGDLWHVAQPTQVLAHALGRFNTRKNKNEFYPVTSASNGQYAAVLAGDDLAVVQGQRLLASAKVPAKGCFSANVDKDIAMGPMSVYVQVGRTIMKYDLMG